MTKVCHPSDPYCLHPDCACGIKKECGTCRHWDAGLCYRFPPQMAPYPWDNQQPITYYPAASRPEVSAADRACGEWVAA